jgi:hypothetical protein
VKQEGMTLRTEAGRIQVLKYILEVTAEHDEKGMFSDESGTVANEEYVSGEQLA